MKRSQVLEFARRNRAREEGVSASRPLDRLRSDAGAATGLPESWNRAVTSFYELLTPPAPGAPCSGTACRFADPRSETATSSGRRGPCCLGRCYEAPARYGEAAGPIPRRAMTFAPVVLRHVGVGARSSLVWDDYSLPAAEEIVAALEASRLRGRGGAAFLTAAKWKLARDTPAPDRYVVANGDEGDPGAYVDRLLLEEAPHSVLAGMVACARAIGAHRGVVYVRAEYGLAAERVRAAIAEAEDREVLGGLRVEVAVGAGSYVAGEETALLRSIEGMRAEPSPKPPYPAESGLGGLPTVVQNVETLSVVPWVVRRRRRADTKAVCLSGAVNRAGIVEIDLGTPLRRVIEEGGAGAPFGVRWKMAVVGGPLGRIVAEKDFDVPMSFDALPGMGHAGVVVLDERVSPRALAEHLFEFARSESCGSCTPCRVGTSLLADCRERGALERLLATIEEGSLCGFGQGVARPLRDLLAAFGNEVFA